MEKCNGNDHCQFIAFAEKDEKLGTSSLCVLYDRCEYVAVHKRFTTFEKGCKGNILENGLNYMRFMFIYSFFQSMFQLSLQQSPLLLSHLQILQQNHQPTQLLKPHYQPLVNLMF